MRAIGRRLGGGDQSRILGAIAFGWFLTLGLRFLLPVLLPQIRDAYAVSNATVGVAISVVWMSYGLMQFPAGMLVDRFGARTLLSSSLALAGVSLGLISVAPVFSAFLVACGLFGLATGLFGTSRGIALSRLFTSNPGRAFGITLGAGSIGSAALPFVGGTLTETVGWRATVAAATPLFLAMAVGTKLIVPATTDSDAGSTAFSRRAVTDTLRSLHTDRAIVVSFLGMTLLLFTFQAVTSFLPTYLIQEKGLTPPEANGLFALLFLTGAGFQFAGGDAVDRHGTRPVILLISAVGVLTLAVLPSVEGLVALAILIVVLSSRIGVPSVLNPYIIDNIPDAAKGSVWGLLRTTFFVVGSTGSTVVGVLADYELFDESFYLLAALTAVATIVLATLPESE